MEHYSGIALPSTLDASRVGSWTPTFPGHYHHHRQCYENCSCQSNVYYTTFYLFFDLVWVIEGFYFATRCIMAPSAPRGESHQVCPKSATNDYFASIRRTATSRGSPMFYFREPGRTSQMALSPTSSLCADRCLDSIRRDRSTDGRRTQAGPHLRHYPFDCR